MKEQLENLKSDLRSLIEKYKLTIEEYYNYDGEDNCIGSDYYLKINGELYGAEKIDEILKSLIPPYDQA